MPSRKSIRSRALELSRTKSGRESTAQRASRRELPAEQGLNSAIQDLTRTAAVAYGSASDHQLLARTRKRFSGGRQYRHTSGAYAAACPEIRLRGMDAVLYKITSLIFMRDLLERGSQARSALGSPKPTPTPPIRKPLLGPT